MIINSFVILELCVNNQALPLLFKLLRRHRNSRRRRRLGLAPAQRIEFLLEMVLKRRHILYRLTTMKAHERIFET